MLKSRPWPEKGQNNLFALRRWKLYYGLGLPWSSAGADCEVEFEALGQALDPGTLAVGEAGGNGAADCLAGVRALRPVGGGDCGCGRGGGVTGKGMGRGELSSGQTLLGPSLQGRGTRGGGLKGRPTIAQAAGLGLGQA